MATIFRKSGSPYWWTAFFDSAGKRHYLSTKKLIKSEAIVVGAERENRARKVVPADDEKRQRILRLLEDAADLALRGTLSEAAAQGILSRMMQASTGESLRQVSIADWLQGWVAEKKGSKANGTFVRYEGVIEAFIKGLPAGKSAQPLAALSVADIRKFRDKLLAEGRAPATANIAVKILRGPLNLARRQGLLLNNPAEAVDMVTSDAGEKGVFTPKDIAKLLAAADDEWKGLILAGYFTGARLGDLAKLRQKDVDLERMSIAFGQIKTKQFIEIPVHPEFGKWLASRPEATPGQPVFPSFHGAPIGGATGLSVRFKTIMAKAGIEVSVTERSGNKGRNRSSHSFHSLRHSFNSAMANAGVSQEIRQRLTGHASKAINDRYTHTDLETLRKAVGSVPSFTDEENAGKIVP